MNKRISRKQDGGAIIMAMLFAFIAIAMTGAYLGYTASETHASMRALDYQKAKVAAEAALEYGIIKLRDVILRDQLDLWTREELDAILAAIPAPNPMGEYEFITPGGQPAFEIVTASDVQNGVISQGVSVKGSDGQYQYFTVRAGALNPETGVGAVLRKEMQGVGLFLIRFGVFYEEDLEILPGADMWFEGPVHANGDLYVNCNSTLHFTDRVTSHNNMYRGRKDRYEVNPGSVTVRNKYETEVAMNTDSTSPTWMIDALAYWHGRVLSGSHGVQHLSPPIAEMDVPHDIVERPIAEGDAGYQAATEREKFANKACLTLHVQTDGTLTATDPFGNNVSHYFTNAVLMTNGSYSSKPLYSKNCDGDYRFVSNGVYSVSNVFHDARAYSNMIPVDIYVDQLIATYPQVADATYAVDEGRGVVYVTRDDPDGAGGLVPCVRLRNARTLPENGLTFATDLPIYIEGNYNTNTVKPALVTGDAVTFLSSNWQDARSAAGVTYRCAVNSTYNTVIMTGNTETIEGGGSANYNGGLENVLRFLENWGGKTVYYRGSIIDLWYSEIANAKWRSPGTSSTCYYNVPTRNWGYDTIYRTRVPPGMTRVFGVEELAWHESTWAEEGW